MIINKEFSSQEEMYNFYFQELMANRRDDVIRTVKALERQNDKEKKSDKILRYYMNETGGGDPLSSDELEQLKAAWGPLWDAGIIKPEWSALYKKKTGHFSPYYIGHDLHYYYTEWQKIDFDYVAGFCDKNYIDIILPYIKHPKTLVRKIHWTYVDESFKPISLTQAIDTVCNYRKEGCVLKISRSSYGGKGVNFIDENTTRDEIHDLMVSERDITVQTMIHQHSRMAALNPSSVNSIRIMTMLLEGKVIILSSVVRIGNSGSKVDNFSSGGIACGVTSEGKLTEIGYTRDGSQVKVHPNGFRFGGYEVPGYQKTVEALKRLHYCVPVFGIISWDIAIDEDEDPVLIEYNVGQGGILTHQYNNGPLYGQYHDKIIKAVFKNFGSKKKGSTLDFGYSIDAAGVTVVTGSKSVRALLLPKTVQNSPVVCIAESAFSGNANLNSLVVEGALDSIQYLAFYQCRSLEKVSFLGPVKEICRSAFNACTSLRELRLPEGSEVISMRAFSACPQLERVVLPASIREIHPQAFERSPRVVIYAPKGSYAEQFARENKTRCISL